MQFIGPNLGLYYLSLRHPHESLWYDTVCTLRHSWNKEDPLTKGRVIGNRCWYDAMQHRSKKKITKSKISTCKALCAVDFHLHVSSSMYITYCNSNDKLMEISSWSKQKLASQRLESTTRGMSRFGDALPTGAAITSSSRGVGSGYKAFLRGVVLIPLLWLMHCESQKHLLCVTKWTVQAKGFAHSMESIKWRKWTCSSDVWLML